MNENENHSDNGELFNFTYSSPKFSFLSINNGARRMKIQRYNNLLKECSFFPPFIRNKIIRYLEKEISMILVPEFRRFEKDEIVATKSLYYYDHIQRALGYIRESGQKVIIDYYYYAKKKAFYLPSFILRINSSMKADLPDKLKLWLHLNDLSESKFLKLEMDNKTREKLEEALYNAFTNGNLDYDITFECSDNPSLDTFNDYPLTIPCAARIYDDVQLMDFHPGARLGVFLIDDDSYDQIRNGSISEIGGSRIYDNFPHLYDKLIGLVKYPHLKIDCNN